ncbi:DUF2914 domain-containing protein [Candidatus Nomurabacteria bacterium]|nr:DUF2914 domain-containing protein [Candidatus Nomurabacteria bacterium]
MKFFEKLKNFFHQYEAQLSLVALVTGFIFDYLTLRRVDFLMDNLFIILYLIFAGVSIIIINFYEDGRIKGNFIESIYEFLPFLLQFSFGGLFSAFVIFYSKSAFIFTSGAFVLILFGLLIGNEFFKTRYSKLVFQVGIYFVSLFSFSIYFLPVLVRQMGTMIFFLSGGISLILISIFIFVIYYLAPNRYKETDRFLILTVLGLYTLINIFYFSNIIPPTPLSLQAGDVYHFIEKQNNGNYLVVGEINSWREKFDLSQKVQLTRGEPVYIFSSIFAPTDIDLAIIHDWQHFDEDKGDWVSVNKIIFPIKGGRNEGYRGFSKKENIFPGKWRVDIKTKKGQVVGRVRFDVEVVDTVPFLETKIL